MQSLIDFLSFKLFISSYVLIICYYMGAIGVPIVSWLLATWVRNKLTLTLISDEVAKKIKTQTNKKSSRIALVSLFIVFLISMEVMWRMLFEFLIAYLQMREALMELTMQ